MNPDLIESKGLPANTEAERLILGSLMLNENRYWDIADRLAVEDFSLEKHRRIYARMSEIVTKGETYLDGVTLADELMRQGQLESVDGYGYLAELTDGLPEIVNLEGYVKIVVAKSKARQALHALDAATKRLLLGHEDADEVLLSHEEAIRAIGQKHERGGVIGTHEMIARDGLDALLAPRPRGTIALPFSVLDEKMNGLRGGQVVLMMARTSRGKSSFAFQIAHAAALQGAPPVIWTMEMSPGEGFQCMAQQISGVWPGKKSMTFEERYTLRAAGGSLQEHPVYFDEHSRSVEEFAWGIRKLRAKGVPIGLGVVDHLQLIRGRSARSRAQEVGENSRAIKSAAKDLDIPMIVLSQVDRASVKGDGKIGLHSAKESGDIENDADVALWIESDEEFSWEHDTYVSLTVGKQRVGPAGFKIPMLFRPSHRKFMEVKQ